MKHAKTFWIDDYSGRMPQNVQAELEKAFGEQFYARIKSIRRFLSFYPLILSPHGLRYVKKILDQTGDEFCCAVNFDPELISSACYSGFLPMAAEADGLHFLLIKLHAERCVLNFNNLRVAKSTLKTAGRYEITMDTAFEKCLESLAAHHEANWIHPPLAASFLELFLSPGKKVRMHSFELWEGEDLAAGEIGYAVGSTYTSLSGFYNRSGAGTVQLYAAAKILQKHNFTCWDLGMPLPYKTDLGAKTISRTEFLDLNRKTREHRRQLNTGRTGVLGII